MGQRSAASETDQHVLVIGAGGHAKVVVSSLLALGYSVDVVLDDAVDKHGTTLMGIRIDGPIEANRVHGRRSVLAVGGNQIRRDLAFQLGADWLTVVHPNAYVHSSVRIGQGTVVFAGAVIQPDSVIGSHAIINTSATVDHDCVVGDFAHLAPGSHLAGGVTLDEGVLMGIGSSVAPGMSVGAWATIGAGGVVVGTIESGVVALGVPARAVVRTPL